MIIQALGNPYGKQQPTTQPLPVPSGKNIVAPLPSPKITQPVAKKTVTVSQPAQKITVNKTIGSLDLKKMGDFFVGGARALPGMVQQGVGIIAEGFVKQKEASDAFFKPITKIVGISQPTYPVDTAIKDKVKQFAQQTREKGAVSAKKASEEFAKKTKPSEGLQGYLEMAAFNLPQVLASTGLSVATAIITKNPALATAVGLSTSYGLGAGEVYNEARRQGLSDSKSLPMSMAGGILIGALDFIPLSRLIRKTAAVETIKKSIIKKIAQGITSIGIQSGWEGITEGAQEIVGNAIAMTYNEHKDLFEGVKEAAVVGALLGGASDVTLNGVLGITGKGGGSAEDKIRKAITTPEEERSEEQKQIVNAITSKEMTPDEATQYVIDNNLGKSEIGKTIMLSVLEAKQENKNLRIIPSEDGKNMEITLSDPSPLPSSEKMAETQPVASETKEKPIVEESGGEVTKDRLGDKPSTGGEITTMEQWNKVYENKQYNLLPKTSPENIKITEGKVTTTKGVKYGTVFANDTANKYGIEVGGANYNVTPDGVVHLGNFNVMNEYQRQGVATDLLRQIKQKYPDAKIDFGQLSQEGRAFFEAINKKLPSSGGEIGGVEGGVTAQTKKPTNLKITYAKNLTPQGDAIQKRFGKYLEENYQEAREKYKKEFGKVLNTDNARELSEDYAPGGINDVSDESKKARSENAANVHEPASAFIKKMFEDDLAELVAQGIRPNVFFSAGGTGAGKTTAIKDVQKIRELYDNADIVYDTNLNRLESATAKIEQVLKAKGRVIGTYIHRKPVESLVLGALPRANRMGRTVPITEHVKTHVESPTTFLTLRDNYKQNKKVVFFAIDNTRGKGEAKEVSVDFIKQIRYNESDLSKVLRKHLKEQYDKGNISKEIYEGTGKDYSTPGRPESRKEPVRTRKEDNRRPGTEPQRTSEKRIIPSKESPVGTGRKKQSRLFERVKETLGSEYDTTEVTYNELSLEKQAKKVVDLITEDPEKAVRIAKGFEETPPGMTQNAVSVALAETARGNEDFTTAAQLWTAASLRSTRLGQEIVSLRGEFTVNESLNAVKKLVDSRMEQVSRRYNDIIKGLALKEDSSMIKKVDALVKHEAKKVKKLLAREQSRIASAQEIINRLKCK